MALIRRLRNSFQRLHWQLTISYTLVTVAALLVVECIAFGAIFLFLSSDTLPRQLQDRIANTIVPQVQPHLVQQPVDRAGLQETLVRLARDQIAPIGESDGNSALQITLTDSTAESVILAVDASGTIVGAVPAASHVGQPLSAAYPDAVAAVDRALSGTSEKLFARLPDDRLGLSAPVMAEDGRIIGAVLLVDKFPTEIRNFARAVLPFILGSALVLTIGAGVIGTGFGFFTARRLTGRFENLARAADAWSRGDFTTRINDSSHDEIGQLARDLNRMSEQLENLLETRNELTRLETRNRLARDLHDSVKQQIFATSMQIGAARSLVERDTEQAKVHLDNARELITDAQQELKTLIHEMRPAALDGRGLAPALRSFVDDWSRQHDVAVELHIRGERETPLPIEQTLYRVSQEALANVAKHSGADNVEVFLDWNRRECTLRVRDDGAGFIVDEALDAGFGLDSMRDRITALDGSVTIESQPGGGTTLIATVPLPA